MISSFDVALLSTRNCYGYFSKPHLYGNEEDMLFNIIDEILQREILQEEFDDITPSKSKPSEIKELKRLADNVVTQHVKSTWKEVMSISDSGPVYLAKNNIEVIGENEENLPNNVVPSDDFFALLELEEQLEMEIHEAVLPILEPVMSDIMTNICDPLLLAISARVRQSFSDALTGFQQDMCLRLCGERLTIACLLCARTDEGNRRQSVDEMSDSVSQAIQLVDQEILDSHRRVDARFYEGPLQSSRTILWNMYTSDLNALSSMVCFSSDNFNAFEIYTSVLDELSKLVHDALFTFSKEWKKVLVKRSCVDFLSPQQILTSTVIKMTADANSAQSKVLLDILMNMIKPTVQETIITPCLEMLTTLETQVPAKYASDFSLDAVGDRIIRSFVESILKSVVSKFIVEIQ